MNRLFFSFSYGPECLFPVYQDFKDIHALKSYLIMLVDYVVHCRMHTVSSRGVGEFMFHAKDMGFTWCDSLMRAERFPGVSVSFGFVRDHMGPHVTCWGHGDYDTFQRFEDIIETTYICDLNDDKGVPDHQKWGGLMKQIGDFDFSILERPHERSA